MLTEVRPSGLKALVRPQRATNRDGPYDRCIRGVSPESSVVTRIRLVLAVFGDKRAPSPAILRRVMVFTPGAWGSLGLA